MKKGIATFLLLAGLATAVSSCQDDVNENKPSDMMMVLGSLAGASVLPTPIATADAGNVTGTFNKATNELTYLVTFSGLSGPLVAGHFHIGVPPSNVGSVHAVSFTELASPITGKETRTSAGREALMAGNMYVNLHTQASKDGEVRANVVVK